MKDLVIHQDLNMEEYSNSWQNMVNNLLNQCIIHNPCKEYEEENNKKILEAYYKTFAFHGGKTDIEDVLNEIYTYNYDIFIKISEIEMNYNVDFFNKSHDRNGGYINESLQDKINNNADSWYEMHYYDNFRLLDEYIRILLYHGRLHYLIPRSYDECRYLDNDLTISVNDCQNTLMDKIEVNDIESELSIDDYLNNLPESLNVIDYANNYNNSFRIIQD